MASVQEEFRATMSRFATGVTVVTTAEDGLAYGATVNAFCSVSLDPPLVLISLEHQSNTLAVLRRSGVFAINVLTAAQQHLARRFARKEVDGHKPFSDIALHTGVTGALLFSEALARIECRMASEYPGGDHTLVLGEVVALDYTEDDAAESAEDDEDDEDGEDGERSAPLTYYRSAFGTLRDEHAPLRTPVPAVESVRAR